MLIAQVLSHVLSRNRNTLLYGFKYYVYLLVLVLEYSENYMSYNDEGWMAIRPWNLQRVAPRGAIKTFISVHEIESCLIREASSCDINAKESDKKRELIHYHPTSNDKTDTL